MSNSLVKASIKRIKTSTQKLNQILPLIVGKGVFDALLQLQFCKKRISFDVKKCLHSAIANAENNKGLDIDKLVVHSASVGKSLSMKRVRARAKGNRARIIKPFSNLYIEVSERKRG